MFETCFGQSLSPSVSHIFLSRTFKHLSSGIRAVKDNPLFNLEKYHHCERLPFVPTGDSVVKGYETVVQFLLKQRTNISAKDR